MAVLLNRVRIALIDPTKTEMRREILNGAALDKAVFGISIGITLLATIVTSVALKSFPALATLVGLIGIAVAVFCRDMIVICEHTEDLFEKGNIIQNMWNRAQAAFSEKKLVQAITKNTWIIGPIFGSILEAGMKAEASRPRPDW